MTDERKGSSGSNEGGPPGDAGLMEALATALTEDGELLPITEEEVRAAEERSEPVALPARLAGLRFDRSTPAPMGRDEDLMPSRGDGEVEVDDEADDSADRGLVVGEVDPADEESSAERPAVSRLHAMGRRRAESSSSSLWTHAAALGLGAAAAAAVVVAIERRVGPEVPLGGDPAGVPSASSTEPPRTFVLDASCAECCAGSACPSPKAGLERCSSGRECVACDPVALNDSRYRVRVGAVTPAPLGLEVLRLYPKGEPELCVRAGVSRETCVPTMVSERDGGRWTTLPEVFSGEDLAAKLEIRLRWKGVARESLATAGRWLQPLALTPKSLCSGYHVELVSDDRGEVFGTLSVFVDDAHYVELQRAETTASLRELRGRVEVTGTAVHLFETRAGGDRRFVLAVGPFNRKFAEQLRWGLLEQELPAVTSLGLDLVGEPLPLP